MWKIINVLDKKKHRFLTFIRFQVRIEKIWNNDFKMINEESDFNKSINFVFLILVGWNLKKKLLDLKPRGKNKNADF